MTGYRGPRSPGRFPVLAIVLALLVAVLAFAIARVYNRLEGQPPTVAFDRDFKAIGREPALNLKIDDSGTGLRHVSVHLKQKDQDIALVDDAVDGPRAALSRSYDVGKLIAEKYKMQQGPATLTVDVTDFAYRNFLRGNRTQIARDFEFEIYPPKLEVLSGQHYINQGGSECVLYRVSGAEVSGVQAGPHFFPGYPANLPDKDVWFALFAYAYDLPPDAPVQVIARDAAGNESKAEFWHKVFPRKFRSRDIVLEDSFVQKVVPEIMSHTPGIQDQGDPVQTFVEINSKLRQKNHQAIADLARSSGGRFLWNGAFLQLSNSKVESYFADRRTYIYHGKSVDQQDHVGFDLSVVQHTPIEAGNDGKVVYADYFGIYGNTVMIDHGAGLISLYAHMSSIDVKPGQNVKKNDIIGKSGATGLAGGDHLHFGLFLDGVPVNPTEWWDPKWIRDHITDRMQSSS